MELPRFAICWRLPLCLLQLHRCKQITGAVPVAVACSGARYSRTRSGHWRQSADTIYRSRRASAAVQGGWSPQRLRRLWIGLALIFA